MSIVFLNPEEDGVLGGSDFAACFVNNRREPSGRRIFFEMVGDRNAVRVKKDAAWRRDCRQSDKFGYARQAGYDSIVSVLTDQVFVERLACRAGDSLESVCATVASIVMLEDRPIAPV